MRFESSRLSNPAGASIGATTGAVVSAGADHRDPDGFLGLNWSSVRTSVLIAVLTAVVTDIALTEFHEYRKRKRENI